MTYSFINPLRVSKISGLLYKKWRAEQLTLIFIMLLLLILLMALKDAVHGQTKILVMLSLFWLFCVANFYTSSSEISLAERSEFLSAVAVRARSILWFIFLIVVASVYYSRFYFDTLDSAIMANGALLSKVQSGELWRLVVGSFIHSGIEHLILNSVLLVFLLPIASFFGRKNAIFLFIIGMLVSQISYVTLGYYKLHDGYVLVGISGGEYALLGFIVLDSCMHPDRYPKRFFILTSVFSLVVGLGSFLLNPNASSIAHGAGFLFGLVYSFCRGFCTRHNCDI